MAGDCKSSDFGHNRFDPYHLHQVLVCSYRGYYCGLSIHLRGFDSPTDRQVYVGVRRTARQRIANPHNAGSNPVTHSSIYIIAGYVRGQTIRLIT